MFSPKRIPSIPSSARVDDSLVRDILSAIRTILETRMLGVHGIPDTVVLRGELGSDVLVMDAITDILGGYPNLKKVARGFDIVNGIIVSVGEEETTEIKPKAYTDIAMGLQASPSGASAPGLASWNASNIYAYSFLGSGPMEQLFGTCEYNHDYREGADIRPHVHWAPSTSGSGNVKWNLDYVWDDMNEGPSSVQTISVVQAASGVAWRPQVAAFPDISGVDKKIGSQIMFRLWRNSADVSDTFAGGAVLQTFGFHAEVDSFGSAGVFTK